MEEYRQRLEALTGERNIWEEYVPPPQDAIPTPRVGVLTAHKPGTSSRLAPHLPPSKASDPSAEGAPDDGDSSSESSSDEGRALEKAVWPEFGLEKGALSPNGQVFSSWKLVKLYPYAFVGKRNSERAAPFFEEPEIYQDRTWDFFYIYHPGERDDKPILLVPTCQFERLLQDINDQLGIALTIPHGAEGERYNLCFGLGGATRPRFLGRSTDLETFVGLENSIPTPDPADNLADVPFRAKEDFLEQLTMIRKFQPKKSADKSAKNRMKQIRNRRAWGRSLKRVQRYLGLRSKSSTSTADDLPKLMAEFSLDQPTRTKPEGSVRFVSVDIEAYEFNHDIITEVGIATLNTRDIVGVPPGEGGKNWMPSIHARHIRIKENAWARNVRHVHGCAANFDFGQSEFVRSSKVGPLVEDIINDASSPDPTADPAPVREKQPLVLVFHDSSQDMKYLKALGVDVYRGGNLVEIVDTRDMYQFTVRAPNPTKLASVLDSLGLLWRYLHNAGNDAVYTMQAMVAMAVKRRQDSLEKPKPTSEEEIPYSEFGAAEKAKKIDEGWSSGGENSDGGDANAPVDPDPGFAAGQNKAQESKAGAFRW